MIAEIQVINDIKRQLAHVMACYADNPEEFAYKLESLILEWFLKGMNYEKSE